MSVGVRFVVGVAALVLSVGCSGGPGSLPPPGQLDQDMGPSADPPAIAASPGDGGTSGCASFETRDCTIDLGTTHGVHNCAKGTQVCEDGVWSACAPLQL